MDLNYEIYYYLIFKQIFKFLNAYLKKVVNIKHYLL